MHFYLLYNCKHSFKFQACVKRTGFTKVFFSPLADVLFKKQNDEKQLQPVIILPAFSYTSRMLFHNMSSYIYFNFLQIDRTIFS